jgi:hypothetical protein
VVIGVKNSSLFGYEIAHYPTIQVTHFLIFALIYVMFLAYSTEFIFCNINMYQDLVTEPQAT